MSFANAIAASVRSVAAVISNHPTYGMSARSPSENRDSPTKVDIGGLEFVADAFPANASANQGRPDSDGARAKAYLAGKGLKMAADDIMLQRLVHLVDKEKRNELMIIYIEASDAQTAARWPEASKGLLERATKGLKITRQ